MNEGARGFPNNKTANWVDITDEDQHRFDPDLMSATEDSYVVNAGTQERKSQRNTA